VLKRGAGRQLSSELCGAATRLTVFLQNDSQSCGRRRADRRACDVTGPKATAKQASSGAKSSTSVCWLGSVTLLVPVRLPNSASRITVVFAPPRSGKYLRARGRLIRIVLPTVLQRWGGWAQD
jgi:hypothetical protein